MKKHIIVFIFYSKLMSLLTIVINKLKNESYLQKIYKNRNQQLLINRK